MARRLQGCSTNPAWKLKPSWYMVAQSDRIISPDLERMYAARAHRHTVEIGGASHSVYRSHPKEVASLIKQASLGAADPGAGRADAPTRTPRQGNNLLRHVCQNKRFVADVPKLPKAWRGL